MNEQENKKSSLNSGDNSHTISAGKNGKSDTSDSASNSMDEVTKRDQQEDETGSAEIDVGSIIDKRFRVISLLGQGGMGSVFLGKQLSMDRLVAIKVLHSQALTDNQQIQRFRNEGKALALLKHPRITLCLSFGVDKFGQPFLVMEHLEGKSLSALLKESGALDVNRAIDITLQIADALSYAHKNGVIHRDIKPSNIMLCSNTNNELKAGKSSGMSDEIKVLDFGIAKVVPASGDNNQRITKTGEVLGTLSYMSPEQLNFETIDQRSDIFSLGVLLYELLSGRQPFKGETPLDTVSKITTQDPAPIERKMPDGLKIILMQCLEKNPANRYQNMEQVQADLQSIKDNSQAKIIPIQKLLQTKHLGSKIASILIVPLVAALIATAWFLLKNVLPGTTRKSDSSIPLGAETERVAQATLMRDKDALEAKASDYFFKRQDYQDAKKYYEKAIKLMNSHRLDSKDFYMSLGKLHFGLAWSLLKLNKTADGTKEYLTAANLFKTADPKYFALWENNSYHFLDEFRTPGDFDKEEFLLNCKINICKMTGGHDSLAVAKWERELGLTCGQIYDEKRKSRSSDQQLVTLANKQKRAYRDAFRIYDKFDHVNTREFGETLIFLSDDALNAQTAGNEQTKDWERYQKESEQYREKVFKLIGKDPNFDSTIAQWVESRISAHLAKHAFKAAEPYFEKLVEIAEEKGSAIPQKQKAIYLQQQGRNYLDLQAYGKAERILKEAVKLSTEINGAKADGTIAAYADLAQTYFRENKVAESEKAIAGLEKIGTPYAIYQLARMSHAIAYAQGDSKQFEKSLALFKTALAAYDKLGSADAKVLAKKCRDEIDEIHSVYPPKNV